MAKGKHVLSSDLSLAPAAAQADITIAIGTPAAGTVDVTGTPTQATINNNFATVATEINKLKAALRDAGIVAS